MAATMAVAVGHHRQSSTKHVTRLGHHAAEGRAQTYNTFATVYVWADGHGEVEVRRGTQTWRATFNAEDLPLVVRTND